jgi:tRNA(fMet)-specific endonuclease VapC
VRLQLERDGLRIGAYDMLIAAHVKCLGLICITNDKAFRRVNGLEVEDWR